ncbi:hypothetical protein IM792_09410 [Mucilaginibacter sp. JRF]|uniref:hypothetical protein n=1 Tax=Mucilaginibacter sp. JRF TaxID=2780088 RepID=UPI00188152B0|nr:hypothetical protein [Mucilaginibacter sp. JRF]MBE9584662.1 hypothetical protein [Mucilaginibacter sp. JRF]
MKRILTLALLLGVVLLASSCRKEVTQVIQPNQTVVFPVTAASWQYDEARNTWYVNLDMPEIDSYIQENGGVLVYMNREGDGYEQVPFLYDQITYSYVTFTGGIQLVAQYYDADASTAPEPPRPASSTIKVVIIDSVP